MTNSLREAALKRSRDTRAMWVTVPPLTLGAFDGKPICVFAYREDEAREAVALAFASALGIGAATVSPVAVTIQRMRRDHPAAPTYRDVTPPMTQWRVTFLKRGRQYHEDVAAYTREGATRYLRQRHYRVVKVERTP